MKDATTNKCQTCGIYAKAGGFCDQLTETQLDTLSSNSRTRFLKRGEMVSNKDLLIWPIMAVGSGAVSLQHLLEDGRRTIAALYLPGDLVDLRGISRRNHGHMIALGKSEICCMSPEVFEASLFSNLDAQRVAWNNLRAQTFRAVYRAADLAKKQALEKLASFLFECRRRQLRGGADGRINIPVRRVDLADYLGMQPETVSRCFRDLEEREIIEFQDISNLRILDFPTLRRIANGDKNTENLRNTVDNNFKIFGND